MDLAIKTKSNQQTLNISSTFEKPQVIQIPPSNIDDKYHIIWLKSGNTSQEQSISLNLVSNNQTICEITKKINFETPIDMSKLSSISLLFSITSSQGHSQLFVDCTGNIEVNVGECRLKLDVFYQGEKYCDYIKNSAIGNWNNFKLNLPSNMNQFQSWKMVTKSTGPCKDLSGYMFVGKIIDDKGTEHNFDLIHSVDSKTCEKTNSISQQYSSISGMMFQYGNSFCSSIGLEDCEFSDPTRSNEIFITKKCPKSYNSILIGFSIFGVFALTSLLIFIIVLILMMKA
eukprot:gene8687-634_t